MHPRILRTGRWRRHDRPGKRMRLPPHSTCQRGGSAVPHVRSRGRKRDEEYYRVDLKLGE